MNGVGVGGTDGWKGVIWPFGVCAKVMLGVPMFGVPLGVAPAGGAMALGAGVDGALTLMSCSGFGFILVIKNDIFAPDMFGSHSKKLYDGKCR